MTSQQAPSEAATTQSKFKNLKDEVLTGNLDETLRLLSEMTVEGSRDTLHEHHKEFGQILVEALNIASKSGAFNIGSLKKFGEHIVSYQNKLHMQWELDRD